MSVVEISKCRSQSQAWVTDKLDLARWHQSRAILDNPGAKEQQQVTLAISVYILG